MPATPRSALNQASGQKQFRGMNRESVHFPTCPVLFTVGLLPTENALPVAIPTIGNCKKKLTGSTAYPNLSPVRFAEGAKTTKVGSAPQLSSSNSGLFCCRVLCQALQGPVRSGGSDDTAVALAPALVKGRARLDVPE